MTKNFPWWETLATVTGIAASSFMVISIVDGCAADCS
jgi:nicotinamide riboside transporter PnuC